ncbi:unnamed protein product [Calypogeia fissa]
MSGLQHGLKRREPDDLVRDLLNVSLSPQKKLRFSDPGVTVTSGFGSNFGSARPSETPWGLSPALSTPVAVVTVSPPRSVTQEEKALVLYRPVTPPMFPGAPPAGSVDFPYKLDATMLSLHQGTDSELTPHQLDCQSAACSNYTDNLSGHGLFQALDLSGGPISSLGQRRLNRVSSCSSLPRFSLENEDQVMVEEVDKSADLAVIPWVPMTPVVVPPKVRPIIEEVDDDSPDVEDPDAMMDGDSMEVVDENNVVITEDSMTPMVGQFGSPMPSFSAAPWQAEALQPPLTAPMWSH